VRIRQIKPTFWVDKTMASLPFRTRLVYIGMWQMADDGGWLLWDVAQAGAELLPFESAKTRERLLAADMDRLVDAGRIIRHDCGHVEIPTLVDHQRFGGRPVFTAQIAHARDCARPRADAHDGRERNGRERNGSGARADARSRGGFQLVRDAAAAAGVTDD
jgi:hypothetical protein